MPEVELLTAGAAKKLALEFFRTWPEVVGIGIGFDPITKFAIKVNLVSPVNREIPADFLGVPVQIEVTGPIYAF